MKRSILALNSNELGWLYSEICYGFGSYNLSDYENDLRVDESDAALYAQLFLEYVDEMHYENTKEKFIEFITSL